MWKLERTETEMDPRSGHIYDQEMQALLEPKHRNKLVEIPAEQLDEVRLMNRKQRRAWAAARRKGKV